MRENHRGGWLAPLRPTHPERPESTKQELRRQAQSLQEKRRVEDLAKDLRRVEHSIRTFRIDLQAAPNLRELRRALVDLTSVAQELEARVVKAMMSDEVKGAK